MLGKSYIYLISLFQRATNTTEKEVWIRTPDNLKLYCHIHQPKRKGYYPGIVMVPGGNDDGSSFDSYLALLTADRIADKGFVVVHFDPEGRGKSQGEENHWGYRHQDNLHSVLKFLSRIPGVDTANLGLFSISLGISIVAGALARYPEDPPVRYIFDWEGPSNRFNITLNGKKPELKQYPPTNEAFWAEREACRFISNISCGYFRFQRYWDHVQGKNKEHAIELLNLATKGKAKWTCCNDNPQNIMYDNRLIEEYHWIKAGELKTSTLAEKYLLENC